MSSSRTIVKNLFSNSIAEVANKGIVFLSTVYLTRIIFADGYGVLGIANSYVIYLISLVSLGFNYIAIRDVSKDKSDENVIKYINHITTIRSLIALISFIGFTIFTYFLEKPIDEKVVIFICGFNVFSTAFQLDWLYQTLEKMEIIALRQLLSGTLNLIGIVIFVHNRSDVYIAMIVMVSTLMINSLWMFILYLKIYKNFRFSYNKIFWKYLLNETYKPALINMTIAVYTNINLNIMSFLSTNDEAGYFKLAFQIFQLVMLPATIIQVTYFPILSRAITINDRKNVLKNYSKLIYFVGAFVTIFIFGYSDIVISLFGKSFSSANITLKILIIALVLTYLDTVNVFPLMAWKKDKVVLSATFIACIVGVSLNLILIPLYQSNGAAISLILTEIIIFSITSYYLYKESEEFYAFSIIKYLLISIIAMLPSFIRGNIYFNVSLMVLSFIIYIGLNFAFKTVTFKEIKGLLKR
jgi:O-antigen/teichoic acid export membrane protein